MTFSSLVMQISLSKIARISVKVGNEFSIKNDLRIITDDSSGLNRKTRVHYIKIIPKKTTIFLVFKMGMNVTVVIKRQSSYQHLNLNAINRARVINPNSVAAIGG